MPASQPETTSTRPDTTSTRPSLKITLVKSTIGQKQNQKDTARALGLRKMHQTVVRPDNPQMRGMVFTIRHLVNVEEVDGASEGDA